MPTYEYACKSCGKHLEVQQSFTDDALTTCPTCGGPLRKVFGNIAISFKGSGFYSTDNRSVAKAGGSSGKAEGEGHSEAPAAEGGGSSEAAGSAPSPSDAPKPSTEAAKPSEKTAAAAS